MTRNRKQPSLPSGGRLVAVEGPGDRGVTVGDAGGEAVVGELAPSFGADELEAGGERVGDLEHRARARSPASRRPRRSTRSCGSCACPYRVRSCSPSSWGRCPRARWWPRATGSARHPRGRSAAPGWSRAGCPRGTMPAGTRRVMKMVPEAPGGQLPAVERTTGLAGSEASRLNPPGHTEAGPVALTNSSGISSPVDVGEGRAAGPRRWSRRSRPVGRRLRCSSTCS